MADALKGGNGAPKKTTKVSKPFPIRVTVPLYIGGSAVGEIEHKSVTLTIWQIYNDYLSRKKNRINFNPPYQRDRDIWSLRRKQDLIGSVFAGLPIPAIYVAKASKRLDSKLYPIDGKQRLSIIKDFLESKFWIWVYRWYEDRPKPERVKVYWQDIKTDPAYAQLADQLKTYQLEWVEFSFMDIQDQRRMFIALNSGVPLNRDEQNYCTNFMARRYFGVIWEAAFEGIKGVFPHSTAANLRFRAIRTVQEFLLLIAGENTKSKLPQPPFKERWDEAHNLNPLGEIVAYGYKALRRQEREENAKGLHEMLEAAGLEFESTPEEILTAVPAPYLRVLKQVLDFFGRFLQEYPQIGVSAGDDGRPQPARLPRNIIDPISYFYLLILRGHLTLPDLDAQQVTHLKPMLEEYFFQKNYRNLKMSTGDRHMMQKKFLLLEELFTRWGTADFMLTKSAPAKRAKVRS